MSGVIGLMDLLVKCGTLLAVAFIVSLSLPNSPMRTVVLKVTGWGFAIICGMYCISPVDIVPEALLGPFGLVDDLVALGVGGASAMAAMNAGKDD